MQLALQIIIPTVTALLILIWKLPELGRDILRYIGIALLVCYIGCGAYIFGMSAANNKWRKHDNKNQDYYSQVLNLQINITEVATISCFSSIAVLFLLHRLSYLLEDAKKNKRAIK